MYVCVSSTQIVIALILFAIQTKRKTHTDKEREREKTKKRQVKEVKTYYVHIRVYTVKQC